MELDVGKRCGIMWVFFLMGIGSPGLLGLSRFSFPAWDGEQGDFTSARSLTRYYQPCSSPALIGSQAEGFLYQEVGMSRHKAAYEALKALGLCHQCRRPTDDGKVACKTCRQKTLARLKLKYDARKASGECARCGNQNNRSGTYCDKCNTEKSAKDKPSRPRIYEDRKRRGLCTMCVKPNDTELTRCSACKERTRATQAKRVIKKYHQDINFRLAHNLRVHIRKLLRCRSKSASGVADLGCTVDFLREHLERQFQPGMSWENYGKLHGQWSIDHIIPLSIVDLTIRDELLKVIHYTNLRPMWQVDNIRKGNKIEVIA